MNIICEAAKNHIADLGADGNWKPTEHWGASNSPMIYADHIEGAAFLYCWHGNAETLVSCGNSPTELISPFTFAVMASTISDWE